MNKLYKAFAQHHQLARQGKVIFQFPNGVRLYGDPKPLGATIQVGDKSFVIEKIIKMKQDVYYCNYIAP